MRRAALVLFILTIVFAIAGAAHAQTAPVLRASYSTGSGTTTFLLWSAVPGAVSYHVRRTYTFPNNWSTFTGITQTSFGEWFNGADNTVVYQVIAMDGAGVQVGTPSNYAMVSKYAYATPPITGGVTLLNPGPITELRSIVTGVRASMGLSAPVWTQPSLTSGTTGIKYQDIEDLRTAINGVTTLLGLGTPAYVQASSLQGKTFNKADVQQLRDILRSYPEMYWPFPAALEPYFSPNGDGVKDTTTFRSDVSWSTGSTRTDFRWQIFVRNSANVVLRTDSGTSPILRIGTDNPRVIHNWIWDGRNAAGAIQPDGVYSYEIVDLDTVGGPMYSNWGRTTVTLDTTPPTATITAPTDPYTISNVRQNGGGSVTVTGSASDAMALESWKLERIGNSQSTVQLGTGTTNATNATLGTLQTITNNSPTVANGTYQLRLTATDKAGNTALDDNAVNVSHFRAVLAAHQINTVAVPAQTVMYTSYVPFTLNETIQVKSQTTNAIVRTIFNGSRAAGTWDDSWDGKNDQGQPLGDGSYYFLTTVTEGASTFVWDETSILEGGPVTQYEYPTCRNDSNQLVACDSSTLTFDPYRNKPLRINFCVGGGHVATGCTGNTPAVVTAKISGVSEDSGTCDTYCIDTFNSGSGPREILWYGTNRNGQYIAGMSTRLLVLRGGTYPRNVVLLTGTAPKISVFDIQPMYFFNPGGPVTQNFIVDVTSPAGRPVSISAQFRNMSSLSVLRTITLPASTAAQQTLSWNGRADNGAFVAPGTYEVILKATDSAGGTATVKPLVMVRY